MMEDIAMHILEILMNSIKAGASKIILTIYDSLQDDVIAISVEDNGKGMDEKTIEEILSGTRNPDENSYDNNGIGMDNVISRLRLFAGRRDVISIKSEGENKGCEIKLSIPLEEN